MPTTYIKETSGGKGNKGMFIERDKKICAAGLSSAQPQECMKGNLEHYLLQEEVDALIGDTSRPEVPKVTYLPPLRYSLHRDTRFAGSFSEGSLLINPPKLSKFQTLVNDLKQTKYNSYWNKPLGRVRDPTPFLPQGYDIYETTAGRKNQFECRLYDIVLPKNPAIVKLPPTTDVAYQTDRNYCRNAYNPDKVFGMKLNPDIRGRYMKCCLTDDRVQLGTCNAKAINTVQVNFVQGKIGNLGKITAPNDNISRVPKGFSFGKLHNQDPFDSVVQCVTMCEINPDKLFLKKCLGHLNTLRKCMRKRFDASFFSKLVLNLKYFDKDNSGWLPKEIIYDYCATKYISLNATLIEPLLSAWSAFDGSRIEYKTFVNILNYSQMPPELPKVQEIASECIDFRTTYGEMVKPGQETDTRCRAGLPSGRYLDMDNPVTPIGCCKADRSYLPHESDAKACLSPSAFTHYGVSHRDMYASRRPNVVRRVFEETGDRFTDEEFNAIWELAKKYHPRKYVSYEPFYRALKKKKIAHRKVVIVWMDMDIVFRSNFMLIDDDKTIVIS